MVAFGNERVGRKTPNWLGAFCCLANYMKKVIIIGAAFVILFYWFGIRPVMARSYCADWALLRAKAADMDPDIVSLFYAEHSGATTHDLTKYLFDKNKTDTTFQQRTYTDDTYKSYYSRCLNEKGI